MREYFDTEECEGILLIDAENAFNSLNRKAALHNIRISCPEISTFILNFYRKASRLFYDGGEISSDEGTTQGDAVAMAMYALGIKNLLQPELRTRKVFFAVDGVSGGMLNEVKHCWRTLQLSGPSIGYFPNAGKTWLITKPQHYEVAKTMFADTGISVTTSGAKHLGAAIGEKAFVDSYLQAKVEKWCVQLETLSFLAIANPQYAYAVYTHGFSSKFSYIMRTIPRSSIFFEPIETILVSSQSSLEGT